MSQKTVIESEDHPIKEKNTIGRLLGFLGSVKLTVFILSFIAIASVLGTLIKQNAPAEEYIYTYPETIIRIIDFFKLYDVYHAPWFIGALIVFAINLVLCTFTRLFIKRSVFYLPDEKTLSSMEINFKLKKDVEGDILSLIKKRFKKKIYEGEDGLIFEKNPFSRYGVPLIHISILFILIGSLVGLLWGYRGFLVLHKSDIKERFLLRDKEPKEMTLGFAIRCKDFNISFYPDGSPKDYVTTVEVIEKGNIVLERDIRVNNPLNYKGLHFYQSSYGVSPLFVFKIDGKDIKLKEHDEYEAEGFIMIPIRFEASIHNFGPGVQVAYLEDGEPKTTWFLRDISKMRQKNLGGRVVSLEDIKEDLWTGLEITYDPGVSIVWIGFGLLLLGLYINFFVISGRIYIRRLPDGLLMAGISAKHKERFKIDLEKIIRGLNGTDPS